VKAAEWTSWQVLAELRGRLPASEDEGLTAEELRKALGMLAEYGMLVG
jgi:hypothetical protein